MRVTQMTIANDMIANLGITYQTLDTIGNQLATGKRIRTPSDDPSGTSYTLDIQDSLSLNRQYQNSAQSGKGWLESSAAALNQLVTITTRARTLAVQAANDTNTASDRTSIANEIQQIMQQVVQIGNQTYAGSSLFAGTAVTAPPFNVNGGYSGNQGAILHQIAPTQALRVNTDPTTIFTGTNGLYNSLSQLRTHLTSTGNPVVPPNPGTETAALSGTYTGPTAAQYLIKVSATSIVNSITYVSAANYSTDGGTTWTAAGPATGTAPALSFPIGATGISIGLTNGAVSPAVGDQFAFTTGVTGSLASNFAVTNGTNVGNETTTIAGNYTGSGNQQFQARASLLDANNNVVGVQTSNDNGVTWSATNLATNYAVTPPAVPVALPAGTATTFAISGLTLTWNQSTVNASTVATNNDSVSFTPTAQLLNNDLAKLDINVSSISGQQAINGANQNGIDTTTTQLMGQSSTLTKSLSQVYDVDFTTASTQMALAETLYKSALAVDAKSIQQSLVDFLR